MPTIVEYTDKKPPANRYPQRIISPSRSGPCCFTEMVEIGAVEREQHWEYAYKRCRKCGFAVRVIVRELPDEVLVKELQKILEVSFQRNVPDL